MTDASAPSPSEPVGAAAATETEAATEAATEADAWHAASLRALCAVLPWEAGGPGSGGDVGSAPRADLRLYDPARRLEESTLVDLVCALAALRAHDGAVAEAAAEREEAEEERSADDGAAAALAELLYGRNATTATTQEREQEQREQQQQQQRPQRPAATAVAATLESGPLPVAQLYLLLAHRLNLAAALVESDDGLLLEILSGSLEDAERAAERESERERERESERGGGGATAQATRRRGDDERGGGATAAESEAANEDGHEEEDDDDDDDDDDEVDGEDAAYIYLHGDKYGLRMGAAEAAELQRRGPGAQGQPALRPMQPLALLRWMATEWSEGLEKKGEQAQAAFWGVQAKVLAQLLARLEGDDGGGGGGGMVGGEHSVVQVDVMAPLNLKDSPFDI